MGEARLQLGHRLCGARRLRQPRRGRCGRPWGTLWGVRPPGTHAPNLGVKLMRSGAWPRRHDLELGIDMGASSIADLRGRSGGRVGAAQNSRFGMTRSCRLRISGPPGRVLILHRETNTRRPTRGGYLRFPVGLDRAHGEHNPHWVAFEHFGVGIGQLWGAPHRMQGWL